MENIFTYVIFLKNNKGKIMSEPNSKLPNLNSITEDFVSILEKQEAPPLYKLSPEKAREILKELQKKYHKEIDADVFDTTIFVESFNHIKLRIVRPKNNKEKLPAILYLHGGGWVIGDVDSYDMVIRKLANCTKSVVIFPLYSLSPEAKYPTAINEIYSVLEYMYDSTVQFNIDKNNIAIVGDSVGGNMATVTAIRTKNKRGPQLKFQCLFYPVTNADMDTKSYELFKDGPWLSKKAMEWFFDAYAPKKLRNDIYISPLKAQEDDLKNLPPALIITAENDVLRDEGEAYGRKLELAGVDVLNIRMNGTIHDFVMLNALSESQPAKASFDLACSMLKNALYN